MKKIFILVKQKKNSGTKYSKKIRNKKFIPAIIYGKNKKNIMLYLKHDYIYNIIKKNQIKHKIKKINFKLKIKNKNINVRIKEIQKHPFKNKILHIDFLYI